MKLFDLSRLHQFRKSWRKKNGHNYTYPLNIFQEDNVYVGNYTYGGILVYNDVRNLKLRIGNFCSIANDVCFLLGIEHRVDTISSFPFKVKLIGNICEATSKGDIIIDDDVWIGYRSIILSGVHIGQGAVIAAGAVVTKDVPPYTIVGGVPAKVIKYRFTSEITDYLLTMDYSKLDQDMIERHIDALYMQISTIEINELKRIYDWFPKKEAK